MVSRWQIFGDFLGPAFPASNVQHVSDLHPKFALRPYHVWKYGRQLRSGEEKKKKEDRRRTNHGKNIMSASAMQGGHT